MTTQAEVLYVPDMARKLGRTEASIRSAVNRGTDDLPPRLEGRRLAWRTVTVDAWLAAREKPAKPAKAGRKAKAAA